MGFFDTLGGSLSDLFTGRWTGGQTNLAHDNLTPLAITAGAIAAPFAAGPALGALGLGAGEAAGAGALGADVAAAAPEAGTLADLGVSADPSALGAFAEDTSAMGGSAPILPGWTPAPYADTGLTSLDDAAMGIGSTTPGLPTGLGGAAPQAVAGGGSGTGLGTLFNPSQWTLPGVAKGAGVLAAGAGLGLNLLRGNPNSAAQNNMQNVAGAATQQFQQLSAESTQLRSYLENGTLPPAFQAGVLQRVQAAKAAAISNAAKNGQATDPTQNTELASSLAAADQQGLIMTAQLEADLFQQGQTLLSTGFNNLQLSGNLWQSIQNIGATNDANFTKALQTFVSSLGGGTGLQASGVKIVQA